MLKSKLGSFFMWYNYFSASSSGTLGSNDMSIGRKKCTSYINDIMMYRGMICLKCMRIWI